MTAVEERLDVPAERPAARRTPYQGLVPYSEEDADYFFGRNAWREIVADHLLAYRVSVLYGASGVGKTSVLRAGVVHDLRAAARRNLEAFGEPEVVPVIVSRWGGDPRIALASGIEDGVAAVSPELARDPPTGALGLLLAEWAERLGGPLAVILDQFDEYFVYHERDAATSAFADELSEALLRGDVPGNFLVSIREDALAKLDRFGDRIPGLWQNLLRIDHLEQEAAREAIEKPIARWNEREGERIELEDGLVEAVLAESDAESIRLDKVGHGVVLDAEAEEPALRLVEAPYLQLVMTRLWEEERRRGSRTLHVETLTRMGGGDQIVRRHFDSVMRALPRRRRKVAARIFRYLVTPAGTKIALPASALAKWSKQKERKVVPVLQTLADSKHRILRTVSTPGDHESGTSYEIYHDRLAPGILDWGRRFARRRRFRRLMALVVAPAILLALYGNYSAFTERQLVEELRRDEREEEAARVKRLREVREDALRAVAPSRYFAGVLALHDAGVKSVVFSTDGKRVLTGAGDGTVKVVTLPLVGDPTVSGVQPPTVTTVNEDGTITVWSEPEREIRAGAAIGRAIFGPGDVLAIEAFDGTAGIWDQDGKRFDVPADSYYASVVLSADGRTVVAADSSGASVWSVDTGRRLHRFEAAVDDDSFGELDTVTMSPDGTIVVTAGMQVEVWEVSTGRRLRGTSTEQPVLAAVTPDGNAVLTVSSGEALMWSLDEASPTRLEGAPAELPGAHMHPDPGALVDFSPDGRVVIAGTISPTISHPRGGPPVVLRGHSRLTLAARFSADGERVATAGRDGTALIWDASTGDLLYELTGHRDTVNAVAFDPQDSNRVVTAANDGTVILWDTSRRASD